MSGNISMCPVVMTVSHFRLTKVLLCSSVPLGSCSKCMEAQGKKAFCFHRQEPGIQSLPEESLQGQDTAFSGLDWGLNHPNS